MYKLLLVPALFITLIGAEASAQMDPFDFCESLTFSRERDACHETRSNAYYIDHKAVSVCSSLTFNSDKLNCFRTIVDHRFDQRDLNLCRDRMNSQKITCLESVRQPMRRPPTRPPGCNVSYREIESELERTLLLLRRQDTRRASAAIDRLLFEVRGCRDRW